MLNNKEATKEAVQDCIIYILKCVSNDEQTDDYIVSVVNELKEVDMSDCDVDTLMNHPAIIKQFKKFVTSIVNEFEYRD